jgi:hypothetical protein
MAIGISYFIITNLRDIYIGNEQSYCEKKTNMHVHPYLNAITVQPLIND